MFARTMYALSILDNPCEGDRLTVTLGTAVASPQNYASGASAMVITWDAVTYTSDPAGSPCALTYAATTSDGVIEPAVVVDNTARTLTVSSSDATLVNTDEYTYVVNVLTPSGATVSGASQNINIVVGASLCDPPTTTTVTTTAAQSFTVGQSADLTFTWTAWTALASDASSCTLGYAVTVPAAIAAAVTCTAATRTCVVATATAT